MTLDEILTARVAELLASALSPLRERVAALEARQSAPTPAPAPTPTPAPAPAPTPAPTPAPSQPTIEELVDAGFAVSRYVLHAEARPGWLTHFRARRAAGRTDEQIIVEIAEIIERDGAAGMLQLRSGPVLSGQGVYTLTGPAVTP